MANRVLALVGMCGSGKSIVNDYFKEKGFFPVYFGGVTIEEVKKRGLEVNEQNEKTVREELRKEHGMAAYAILNLPKIKDALAKANVIVDGLYSWSEYKVLKDEFQDNLVVIAVYAPPKLRYDRLSKRPVRPITAEDASKRDFAEIENIEKAGPITMADYTLINDGDYEKIYGQLKDLNLA